MSEQAPGPGWYEDPDVPGRLRWWDGARWGPLQPETSSAEVPQADHRDPDTSAGSPQSPAELEEPTAAGGQLASSSSGVVPAVSSEAGIVMDVKATAGHGVPDDSRMGGWSRLPTAAKFVILGVVLVVGIGIWAFAIDPKSVAPPTTRVEYNWALAGKATGQLFVAGGVSGDALDAKCSGALDTYKLGHVDASLTGIAVQRAHELFMAFCDQPDMMPPPSP